MKINWMGKITWQPELFKKWVVAVELYCLINFFRYSPASLPPCATLFLSPLPLPSVSLLSLSLPSLTSYTDPQCSPTVSLYFPQCFSCCYSVMETHLSTSSFLPQSIFHHFFSKFNISYVCICLNPSNPVYPWLCLTDRICINVKAH